MSAIPVTAANFVRAESDRMFASTMGNVECNVFRHRREPTSVDDQPVIRMNRDTLYSSAIVDISAGAVVTVPDTGARYVSVMVVNRDHYINEVFHEPGDYELTIDRFDTDYVAVVARILVDPASDADLAAVVALQDQLAIDAASARPFVMPDYDATSFDTARNAVLELARLGWGGPHRPAFGRREAVDPIRHLLLTAAGWGGLPDEEASYAGVEPKQPVGEYELTVGDVPVDGFWSISVYNRAGYFEKNERGVYSVNSVTAAKNDDGSVTVRFGGPPDAPNSIPITEGWNYVVRLYRPRPEILDGSWTFPAIHPPT